MAVSTESREDTMMSDKEPQIIEVSTPPQNIENIDTEKSHDQIDNTTEKSADLNLDDTERDFIAKGIHNFSYKKEDCYDAQATEDLRRDVKNAMRAFNFVDIIPEHVIDQRLDSAVLPLGQKRGYWLKRLINKTTGDTQRLLMALDRINGLLRTYSKAKRKAPAPSKHIRIPIEKFHELEERASILDISSQERKDHEDYKASTLETANALTTETMNVPITKTANVPVTEPASTITKEERTCAPKPNAMNTETQHRHTKTESDESDTEDTANHLGYKASRHERRHRPRKERYYRKYYESETESSEESDPSDDEVQYYLKRFKRPAKYHSYIKPKRIKNRFLQQQQQQLQQQLQQQQQQQRHQQLQQHQQLQNFGQEYRQQQPSTQKLANVPSQFFDTSIPLKPVDTVEKKYTFQQNFVPQINKPNNDYINHFLGNTRR